MVFLAVKCPFCDSNLSKVVDKRSVSGRGEIRRRRECLKCGKRFTTYEGLATLRLLVIKKDGRRETYDREKLLSGLSRALEKRPGIDKIGLVADRIEGKMRAKALNEITSINLGKWVLSELKKIDGIAYLRFASVYHTFQDLADFEKEMKSLN
jgi:transcriptional repressor NrdR